MVWADERPIDKPRVRKARDGEVPGWLVIVDYDSGTRTETWQEWEDAYRRALIAASHSVAEWGGPLSPRQVEAIQRYRATLRLFHPDRAVTLL